MKRSLWVAVPLLLFLALVGLLYQGLGRDKEALPSVLVGRSVPDFALPSLMQDATLTPDLFQDRWTVLNVWATWCPTCYVEHPYLMQLAAEGVRLVGINYKDQDDKARQYLADLGNPYAEVVVDARGTLGMDLGVYGAPETFLVGPDGRILLRHAGEMNAQVWQEQFLPLLSRREAP